MMEDVRIRRKWGSRKTEISQYLQLLLSNYLQNFVKIKIQK